MPRELPKEQTNFTLFVTSPISDDGLMDCVNNMFEMNSYMFQIEGIKFLLFFFKCSHRIRLMSFMLQMCITYHTFLNFLHWSSNSFLNYPITFCGFGAVDSVRAFLKTLVGFSFRIYSISNTSSTLLHENIHGFTPIGVIIIIIVVVVVSCCCCQLLLLMMMMMMMLVVVKLVK